jgi:hypothetical protein
VSTVSWTIPGDVDGPKTVWVRYRDGAWNASEPLSATVILDQAPPPAPTNLRKQSCEKSGSNRKVTLTWDGNAAADANFLGYRLYRSVNDAPYAVLKTVSGQSADDVHGWAENSVRFIVRAYDKAGNESGDSNVVSFTKSSCS